MTAVIVAVIGVQALYFLIVWLASAIAASYLSGRKGYGERIGLASGLVLPVLSVIVWLLWPARPDSDWKVVGAFGRPKVTERDGGPGAGSEPAGGGAGPTAAG